MKHFYFSSLNYFKIIFLFLISFTNLSIYSQAQVEIIKAKQYLSANATKFKLTESDVNEASTSSAYLSPTTGWYHVYLNQTYQSVEVHNSMLNLVLVDNQVQNATGNFIPSIASKVNTANLASINLSPLQALQKAKSHLKLTSSEVNKIKEISKTTLLSGVVNKTIFSDIQLSDEDIIVKMYWLPTQIQEGEKTLSSVKLSWNVKFLTKDKQNSWSV